MIKLLANPTLPDKLCFAEPYFGGLFSSAACAFSADPELMSIWVEEDEHGKALSAVSVGSRELMLLSGKGGPGAEMLLFVTKLAEAEDIKWVVCGENSVAVLKNIFDAPVSMSPLMRCSRRIKTAPTAFTFADSDNTDGLLELLSAVADRDEFPDPEMWRLKIVRGVLRGQTTVLTLLDGEKTIAGACIRGRTKAAGSITSVMTLPEYRARGCASFLTAACSNLLRGEGRAAWLVPANERVEKMYERIGFRPSGTQYTFELTAKEKQI